MSLVVRGLLGAALVLCGAHVAAQPAAGVSPPDEARVGAPPAADAGEPAEREIAPGIIVRGQRLPDKAINRYIYDILRPQATGQTAQYPRLRDPFCPSAIGFGDGADAALEKRMRLVADAAGIEMADKKDCRPNMHLVRVESGQDMIRELRKKRARSAFGWIPLHERTRIENLDGPVYAWQQVFPYSAEGGLPIASGNAPGLFEGLPINFVSPACQNPRICLPTQLAFRHAIVLVERKALDDISVTQLADYALMRGLAQVQEDKDRGGARDADTILNLFDAGISDVERMPSISRMDLAMLTSLYSVAGNVNANRQRGRMVATFREVLEELE